MAEAAEQKGLGVGCRAQVLRLIGVPLDDDGQCMFPAIRYLCESCWWGGGAVTEDNLRLSHRPSHSFFLVKAVELQDLSRREHLGKSASKRLKIGPLKMGEIGFVPRDGAPGSCFCLALLHKAEGDLTSVTVGSTMRSLDSE